MVLNMEELQSGIDSLAHDGKTLPYVTEEPEYVLVK